MPAITFQRLNVPGVPRNALMVQQAVGVRPTVFVFVVH